MDLEDAKCYSIIGAIIICVILAFLLPIIISVNINIDKNIEFEKYKIEMQYKHGDVINEE